MPKKGGHEIVLKIDKGQKDYNINIADVAIEFTMPGAAVNNLKNCIQNKVPVVCGTTGWLDYYDEVKKECLDKNAAFLYASNFSLGVNIFFEINRKLAQLIGPFEQYNVEMEEIHHKQKLDEPSGTAITLAEGIIENTPFKKWELDKKTESSNIPIKAIRSPEVPGTHEISYVSEVDTINIKHTAHSRNGFALGAVIAAEWIADKKGVFGMKDVLGL